MVIYLKQLFNVVGERKDFDYNITTEELSDVRNVGMEFISPVRVKGDVFNRTGIVYLDYSVRFTLNVTCARCLAECGRDYHFIFKHIIVRDSDSGNDEYITAEKESIDLNQIAVMDLLLQLPAKTLCKENCKGLCMVCGSDLNKSICEHKDNY